MLVGETDAVDVATEVQEESLRTTGERRAPCPERVPRGLSVVPVVPERVDRRGRAYGGSAGGADGSAPASETPLEPFES